LGKNIKICGEGRRKKAGVRKRDWNDKHVCHVLKKPEVYTIAFII
jgi:hypothetical protein